MTTTTRIPPEAIHQLRQDAETMTCKQLAEKYETTSQSMLSKLNRLGIKCQRIRNNWTARLDELKALAARMTPRELAEHFGTSTDYVYILLARLKIKAAATSWPVRFEGGLEALKQMAPVMNVTELAAHFHIDRRTVRLNLKRLGMECKKFEPVSRPPKAKRIAAKRQVPSVKPGAKKAAKPAPKPAPVAQRAAAPKPTIRREVQTITPADVKRTIVQFRPPPYAPICNGSSTQRYDPKARAISVRSSY